ncbi:hypothetical protein [Effusibacillus lacus]|uniref:hypothetical protein n=1 Tax=Effusibacillus lacus TaxID=1348429 RepID=UPI000BB9925C|nr:hypothetical protein [Effusibacillus lacus]TCS72502.1 hypothetical protein EDD64_1215 [Effusibacillus lacus]
MNIEFDFENFSNKYLTESERKVIEGLDIRLYLNKETGTFYHEVMADKKLSVEEIKQEDKVLDKFFRLVNSEIKSLV